VTLDQPTDLPVDEMNSAAASAEPQIHTLVTIVTVDGVVVRVANRPDGSLVFSPTGNRAPIVLDRFQRGALMAALEEGK
jgi:hypothetical protein